MYRIAVMGDWDSIYGFGTLGLDTFAVEDAVQGGKTLRRLAEGGYAVIYITESLAAELGRELEHYREKSLPAVIPLPGISGNKGIGMRMVRKSVEQAVGSDIIFGSENE
jgi:V/A-type H+-transporting ATPase subunit F